MSTHSVTLHQINVVAPNVFNKFVTINVQLLKETTIFVQIALKKLSDNCKMSIFIFFYLGLKKNSLQRLQTDIEQ